MSGMMTDQSLWRAQRPLALCAMGLMLGFFSLAPVCGQDADAFRTDRRGTVGVIHFRDDYQFVQWIGPDAIKLPWPHLDKKEQTFLTLRAVPNGMAAVDKALSTSIPIKGLLLYGSGLDSESLQAATATQHELTVLALRSYRALLPDELSDLTEQEKSELGANRLSQVALDTVRQQNELKVFELSGYPLPANRLEFLEECKQLRTLIVRDNDLTDHDLQSLSERSELVFVDFSGTAVTEQGLKNLKNCRNLTHLMLSRTLCSDRLSEILQHRWWPRLRTLTVYDTEMSADGLRAAASETPFAVVVPADYQTDRLIPLSGKTPHDIRLYRTAGEFLQSYAGGLTIVRNGQLVSLRLLSPKGRPTDSMMEEVAFLADLECLIAPKGSVTSQGVRKLHQLDRLKVLDLKGNPVDDTGAHQIAKMQGLEELNLSDTDVKDAGVEQLSALGSLELLMLERTRIGDNSLKVLSELPKLRKLDLRGCDGVTDNGLHHLLRTSTLEGIKLDGTGTSPESQLKVYRYVQSVSDDGRN